MVDGMMISLFLHPKDEERGLIRYSPTYTIQTAPWNMDHCYIPFTPMKEKGNKKMQSLS